MIKPTVLLLASSILCLVLAFHSFSLIHLGGLFAPVLALTALGSLMAYKAFREQEQSNG